MPNSKQLSHGVRRCWLRRTSSSARAINDALRRGYRMTIAKMDLLCNMSFRGRGDASSKLGFRVNVWSVFGVFMMMGLFLLGGLHAQTGQSTLTGVVSDSSGAIVSAARGN